ncbi:hypothetical protein TUM12370_27910 [Salmonella enterica subsp. enterica serovar Choleraesuis]|nr:hypothetical protein TUM12370_27910 [Salmonella enterica subsp. enterica serovar Choleraesuis]
MSVTIQESIEALQQKLALVAERQVALRLNTATAGTPLIRELELEYQRLVEQIALLQHVQQKESF